MSNLPKPILYILIGIAGSGKSTWSKNTEADIVCIDNYHGKNKENWRSFRERLKMLAMQEKDIIADACHLKRRQRKISKQVVERNSRVKYKVVAVVFHTDFETCVKRRADRYERWRMNEMRNSEEALESSEQFDAVVHVYKKLSLIK